MDNYIYSNIKYFCRRDDINLSAFEYPMKPGYLSRYYRWCKMTDIPVKVLYKASKTFGVSMEELIEVDFANKAKIDALESEIAELQRQLEKAKKGDC